MSDIERCDICGNPMSLDNSEGATVCNARQCYTSLVRAKAAARGVSLEQALIDDPALAAGLEIAKAVQPTGLFDEESGDGYAEGKMADISANGGMVGDTYIPPNPQLAMYAAGLAAYNGLTKLDATIDGVEHYGTLAKGVEPDQYLPPGTKLVTGQRRFTTQNPAFSAPYGGDGSLVPLMLKGESDEDYYIRTGVQTLKISADFTKFQNLIDCTVADAQLEALAHIKPQYGGLDEEVERLRAELASVKHVAEEKARYWETRCEYAETSLAVVQVSLDELTSRHDVGDQGRLVLSGLIAVVKETLHDREERGIEDLEKTLRDRRQDRILETARRLWGANADVDSPAERAIRFFEEAVELLQSVFHHHNAAWWQRVPDRTWENFAVGLIMRAMSRPTGEVRAEIGGCYFTLAALCQSLQLSGQEIEVAEAIRVSNIPPAQAQAKHQSKLDEGF